MYNDLSINRPLYGQKLEDILQPYAEDQKILMYTMLHAITMPALTALLTVEIDTSVAGKSIVSVGGLKFMDRSERLGQVSSCITSMLANDQVCDPVTYEAFNASLASFYGDLTAKLWSCQDKAEELRKIEVVGSARAHEVVHSPVRRYLGK